jgi:Protein kinase domain
LPALAALGFVLSIFVVAGSFWWLFIVGRGKMQTQGFLLDLSVPDNTFTPQGHRTSSIRLIEQLSIGNATMTVLDPFKKVPFEEADFDEIHPLGTGQQGTVYAIAIHIKNDPEEYRYVVKRLFKRRFLPSCSISGSPSAGTYGMPSPLEMALSQAERSGHTLDTLLRNDTILDGARSVLNGARSVASNASKRKTHKKGPSFDNHAHITKNNDHVNEHNIVKLINVIHHKGEDYALLPYCDLFLDIFVADHFSSLSPTPHLILVCDIMLDLLKALTYLNYTVDYVHRDIKMENIARCEGKWCIIDLECAAISGSKVKDFAGSPYYMHPWCFIDTTVSALPGNDMYALGQVLKQLLLLPPSFKSTDYYRLVDEKIAIHKSKILAKWKPKSPKKSNNPQPNNSQQPEIPEQSEQPSNLPNDPKGRLIHLSDIMCGLMSDQPNIDDLSNEITEILSELNKTPDSPSSSSESTNLFNELFRSSRSDGYFSTSREKNEEVLSTMPKVLERRRSSWGGILAPPNDPYDTDDDFDDHLQPNGSFVDAFKYAQTP